MKENRNSCNNCRYAENVFLSFGSDEWTCSKSKLWSPMIGKHSASCKYARAHFCQDYVTNDYCPQYKKSYSIKIILWMVFCIITFFISLIIYII